jgi:hypothetical protein
MNFLQYKNYIQNIYAQTFVQLYKILENCTFRQGSQYSITNVNIVKINLSSVLQQTNIMQKIHKAVFSYIQRQV